MSWIDQLSDDHVRALARVAKHPTKGAYPFFRDPRAMIELREKSEERSTKDQAQ